MSALIGNHGRAHTEPMAALARERAQSTLRNDALAAFVNGGTERLAALRAADLLIARDDRLLKPRFFDIETEAENRRLTMRQIRRYAELLPTLSPELKEALKVRMLQYDNSFTMRKYVHENLFRETIQAQGTPVQWAAWRERIDSWRVLGCFAMTELGHSSYLRGLETTAEYDARTQEFVISTPTLTATKWWIGGSGEMSTHTVALCQLVVAGVARGLHWFIVPLRDPATGALLPGVTAGSVGPKVGRPGLDNGWIQFSSVRVPRDHLLARWAQVSASGEYSPAPSEQLPYAPLIGERFVGGIEVAHALGQAVTIAVRYGCARLQGDGEHRRALMDFQSHQYQLMPAMANALVVRLVATAYSAAWAERLQLLDADPRAFLADLQDWHSTSSALKAWLGWLGADHLEACRRTMGGHAYSAYNALGSIITNYWVLTTGGGDNVVLAQQVSRYLLSAYQRALTGKPLHASVAYFADHERFARLTGTHVTSAAQLRDIEWQLDVLRWLTFTLTKQSAVLLTQAAAAGRKNADAWNDHLVQLVECSKPHAVLLTVAKFSALLRDLNRDKAAFDVAKQCCDLFVLSRLEQMALPLLEWGYFTPAQMQLLRAEVLKLCAELRGNCIAITDAFYFPDYVLKAPLGRYDGNIYEAYLDIVQHNKKPTAYWNDEIRPLVMPAKL